MRDGHEVRFWRYAVGEIALGVIGILIALQIDNWNDERIEQRQIREYALNLAADIQRDLEMVSNVEFQIHRLIWQAEAFSRYALGRSIEDFDNADVLLITWHSEYLPFTWNRAAMEQLKSSGALRQMRNRHLVDLISSYDALTHHLDMDYMKDVDQANLLQALMDRVRDANYGEEEMAALEQWQRSEAEEDHDSRLDAFRNSEAFASMKARNLPVLINDVRDFRLLANHMRQYSRLISPRVSGELPSLRRRAAEILTLVDEEYQ